MGRLTKRLDVWIDGVRAAQLETAPAGVRCRYRVLEDQAVRRMHQEDLCQALAIDPRGQRGRAKYERAGGPSLRQAAELLDTYSPDPQAELDRLARIVAFTVLIGNADAHGKNLALLHPRRRPWRCTHGRAGSAPRQRALEEDRGERLV